MLRRAAITPRKRARAGRPAWKVAGNFRRWLRKLPCAACQRPATEMALNESAHVDHGGDKGMGTKASDRFCIPLCPECHERQHSEGWLTFERKLPQSSAVILSNLYWAEWPGRREWERELATRGEALA